MHPQNGATAAPSFWYPTAAARTDPAWRSEHGSRDLERGSRIRRRTHGHRREPGARPAALVIRLPRSRPGRDAAAVLARDSTGKSDSNFRRRNPVPSPVGRSNSLRLVPGPWPHARQEPQTWPARRARGVFRRLLPRLRRWRRIRTALYGSATYREEGRLHLRASVCISGIREPPIRGVDPSDDRAAARGCRSDPSWNQARPSTDMDTSLRQGQLDSDSALDLPFSGRAMPPAKARQGREVPVTSRLGPGTRGRTTAGRLDIQCRGAASWGEWKAVPACRNWQTIRTQNPVPARA